MVYLKNIRELLKNLGGRLEVFTVLGGTTGNGEVAGSCQSPLGRPNGKSFDKYGVVKIE